MELYLNNVNPLDGHSSFDHRVSIDRSLSLIVLDKDYFCARPGGRQIYFSGIQKNIELLSTVGYITPLLRVTYNLFYSNVDNRIL